MNNSKSKFQRKHWEDNYGRIPKDWDFIPIGSLFTERKEKSSDLFTYPLHSFTIENGVTPKTERYERSFLLKGDENNFAVVHYKDFVFNPMNLRFGAIGYSRIKKTVSVSSYYNVLTPNENCIDNDFLETYLRSHIIKDLYDKIAIGSLIEKRRIHFSILEDTFIPIPQLPQQKIIGDIVRKWDKAISVTEKLLSQKMLLKNGLMQQLLLEKLRLPGFTESWQDVYLGDIFFNRKETGRTDLPLASVTKSSGVIFREKTNRKDSSSEDKSKYLRICPGDIVYNTMRMWQGVSGLSSIEGIVSPAYTVLTPKEGINGDFMSIFFKYPPIIHLFYRYSQGLVSDTWNLKFHHFAEIKVKIPSEKEQIAISKLFKFLDREISLLNNKRTNLIIQKKGLMQQLLTGKTRVTS